MEIKEDGIRFAGDVEEYRPRVEGRVDGEGELETQWWLRRTSLLCQGKVDGYGGVVNP